MQTNLSVQTVQTNCGGEVGGGFAKVYLQIPPPTSPLLLQIPPPTSPPQLVCTVCTKRLVCTRYVPVVESLGNSLFPSGPCAALVTRPSQVSVVWPILCA